MTTPTDPACRPGGAGLRPDHDPVKSPSHYRGRSGQQSIEITHAYRLGPDLTQAVDYILRAGRKTPDPRQDLAKAAFYLRFAAGLRRDVVFGMPSALRPAPAEIAADFGLCQYRAQALGLMLRPYPHNGDLEAAACQVEMAIEAYAMSLLPAANTGRAA